MEEEKTITARESKQAAKGRMQMYQPAQRLARGNAEQRNGRKWSTVCGHCKDDDGSGSHD